jgi:hypothetical protein
MEVINKIAIKKHRLKTRVNQGEDWIESFIKAAPNTNDNNKLTDIGFLYPAASDNEEIIEHELINFYKGGGSWNKALKYAKENSYELACPREVNAVVMQNPKLLKDLKMLDNDWIHIISTRDCFYKHHQNTYCVFMSRESTKATIHKISYFDNKNAWFLFRKKNNS